MESETNITASKDGGVDFYTAVQEGLERARQYPDPNDPKIRVEDGEQIVNDALLEVYKSDLTGAEKLAAIQAVQRMSAPCSECGGCGWVEFVTPGTWSDPMGTLEQEECPKCRGGGTSR